MQPPAVLAALSAATALIAFGCAQWLTPLFVSEQRLSLVDPAHTVYNFQHLSELLPTRTVARAGAVHAFERDPRPLEDVAYEFDGEPLTIEAFYERSHTAGMVVLHDGRIVFERYALGAGPDTRFTSWSVAKSVTATLVGLVAGDGLVSLDDALERYVPALDGTGYDDVTIKQALQMSSGVRFGESYDSARSDVSLFIGTSMLAHLESANELMRGYPRAAEPGSVFNYSTGETQVLGWLVREVTGKPLAHTLSERIWSRLGMEHDATWVLDAEGPEGVEMAGCCLNAALRDYARFGQLMLQDGVWRGERILPAGWVAEATAPGAPQVQFGRLYPGSPQGYQYQWWINPDGSYSAEGVYGQFVYVNPAARVVIAKASAWPEAWDDDMEREVWAAFGAIARQLAAAAPGGG